MHKFFAKTLFLGKKVVFLPQCHSTNEELTKRSREFDYPEGTIVHTDYQVFGRGQRGNKWIASAGKNILMSVLLRPKFLAAKDQYYLNLISGLAIVDVINGYLPHTEVQLKWPNDVYVNGKKVAGILIESNFKGTGLESSVVGIGFNVNQEEFKIENATSLKMEGGVDLDRTDVLESLTVHLEGWYLKLKNGGQDKIRNSYHDILMWRGEVHRFSSDHGEFFGEIIGINEYGKLSIRVGSELKTFDVKEVVFLG